MLRHQQGAVRVAQAELLHGQQPAVKALAAHVAATRTQLMRDLFRARQKLRA
jgi:uncharacterized protein (DUF305 family)